MGAAFQEAAYWLSDGSLWAWAARRRRSNCLWSTPLGGFRQCARQVAKLLRGAKVADVPVEQPTEFELIINLKTAQTLGVEIPPALLSRANTAIE
ncbi:MAG TPA: ABC transporter substrate binding protein [Steroidobacteraceae bacterium]|nr:ABC transporter substrate binding protein [Steroidobacteraceae bacterium]